MSAPRPTASQNTVISTPKTAFHTSPTHSQNSADDAEELESVPVASAYDCSSIIVCSHNDSLIFFSSRVQSRSSGMQQLDVSQMAVSSTQTVRSRNWLVNFDLLDWKVKLILMYINLGMVLV